MKKKRFSLRRGKNGKYAKCPTVGELKLIGKEHGPLLSALYSRGGGMDGGLANYSLHRAENGEGFVFEKSECAHYGLPTSVAVYRVGEDRIKALHAYACEYALDAWEDLPDSEDFVLDAPSEMIGISFNDSDFGGSRFEYYSISFECVLPEGGRAILNGFIDLLLACAAEEALIRSYTEE